VYLSIGPVNDTKLCGVVRAIQRTLHANDAFAQGLLVTGKGGGGAQAG
jgi:hypothetical protein